MGGTAASSKTNWGDGYITNPMASSRIRVTPRFLAAVVHRRYAISSSRLRQSATVAEICDEVIVD